MDSLDSVLKNLRKVASDNQYEGPAINALINLIGNGIHMNNLNAISTVLEASPTRCKLINSAIQHAKDRGCSVFRGRNQRVHLLKCTATRELNYPKYGQVAKIGKFYLLASDDYSFKEGDTIDMELIVSKSLELKESVVGNNSLTIHTSRTSNYSNEVIVERSLVDGNSESVEIISYSEYKRDVLRDYSLALDGPDPDNYLQVWLATDTDYGIELNIFDRSLLTIANIDIYNRSSTQSNDPEIAPVIDNLALFRSEYTYIIRGVEYTEESIDDASYIKSIPGIKLIDGSIELVQCIPRITDLNIINVTSDLVNISNNIVRTTYELKSIIRNELINNYGFINTNVLYQSVYMGNKPEVPSEVNNSALYIRDVYVRPDGGIEDFKYQVGTYFDSMDGENTYKIATYEAEKDVDSLLPYGNGQLSIVIYYLKLNSNGEDIYMTELEFKNLLSTLKSSYYVNDVIYVLKPIKRLFKYSATIYNKSIVNQYAIEETILNLFRYQIGGDISFAKISSEIYNRFPEVSYIIYGSQSENTSDESGSETEPIGEGTSDDTEPESIDDTSSDIESDTKPKSDILDSNKIEYLKQYEYIDLELDISIKSVSNI